MFGFVFFSAFIAALSGAMMPGPMMTAVVAEAPRKGFWTGPLYVAGHAVLELVLLVLIYLGLGGFLLLPFVRTLCFLAGGPVLIWFAYGLLRSLGKGPAADIQDIPKTPRPPAFLNGILISAANPYWILWWVTTGTASLAIAAPFGPAGYLVFFFGHILADLAWYSFVSFSANRAGRFLPPSGLRIVSIVCAVLLALFGGSFLAAGLLRIIGRT
jgi:threonine/homoserine/homoserine lactone efflux protein